MFLLDSNLWMQIARDRPHKDEVKSFLRVIPSRQLFVTDFAVNSLALNFERRDQLKEFSAFRELSTIGIDIAILRLDLSGIKLVIEAAMQHGLDYDDAYQYVAAEQNQLHIVSFDTDYDRTPTGRLTPAQALQQFTDEQQKP